MFSFFKDNLPLGIDLGTNYIKIVELEANKPLPNLKQYVIKEIPRGIIKRGEIKDSKALSRILRSILQKYDFKTDEIVTAVMDRDVIIRNIILPKMEGDELEEAVKWEVKDYLSFPITETTMDYEVVKQDNNKMEIMLVIVKSSIINKQTRLLERAGFKVKAVEIPALALKRVLKVGWSLKKEDLILLDIGANETKLIGFKQGQLKSRYKFGCGGEEFTTEIKEDKNFNFREARNYKEENDVIKEGLVTNSLKNFFNEFKRYLSYYQIKNQEERIDRLILTGGGAKLIGLKDVISQKLDIKVDLIDMMVGVQRRKNKFSPQLSRDKISTLSTSLGLALRGVIGDD